MYLRRVLLTILAVGVVLLSAVASAAAAPGAGDGSDRPTDEHGEVLDALRRNLGLTEKEALAVTEAQDAAIALDVKLQGELGDAFAGSVFDIESGRLRVFVSDKRAAAVAQRAGAETQIVKRSGAELNRILTTLDAETGYEQPMRADERPSVKPIAIDGIQGWFLDPESNTVRVTAEHGKLDVAAEYVARFGDAVSLEEADRGVAMPTVEFMDGGDGIHGKGGNGTNCSAGFNLRNKTTGQGYLLTAGHCVTKNATLKGWNGTSFGTVLEEWFPTYDDALARNDNPGQWIQGPWIDKNPSNGGINIVSGQTDAPIGTVICKSGKTTKYTCGQITAKNQTVTYSGSQTVYGLTRHDACVRKGDSGGANVSLKLKLISITPLNFTITYAAEGVSSGAMLHGADKKCGEQVGVANVSWYFPVADSLAYFGPKYGLSVW